MKKIALLFVLVAFPITAQTIAQTNMTISRADETSRIYHTPEVDSKPSLKNGMYTLPLFISQNFRLPDVHNKKVKIFIGFVVETDGSISDIKFIYMNVSPIDESAKPLETEDQKRSNAEKLETMKDESVRVLSAFKDSWIPATKNGKPVRCQYNYPINFTLE